MLCGWLHLYGHVHNTVEDKVVDSIRQTLHDMYKCEVYRAYNVGCMQPYMNYTPRTISEIVASKTR